MTQLSVNINKIALIRNSRGRNYPDRPDAPHPLLAFLMLASILQACSMIYLSVLIFSGDKLAATFRSRPLWMALGTGAVGAMFLGFGLRLATATME